MIQIFVVINEETLEDRSLGFIADEIEKIYPEADLCISRVADETNVEVFNSDHKDLIKEEVLWVIHRLVLEEQESKEKKKELVWKSNSLAAEAQQTATADLSFGEPLTMVERLRSLFFRRGLKSICWLD